MRDHWTDVREVPGVSRRYFQRADGAYAWPSQDYYHSNPLNPRHREWMAYGPDQQPLHVNTRRTRLHIPRKWATAMGAMDALDREVPYDG